MKLSDYRTSNGVLLSGAPDFPQRDFWTVSLNSHPRVPRYSGAIDWPGRKEDRSICGGLYACAVRPVLPKPQPKSRGRVRPDQGTVLCKSSDASYTYFSIFPTTRVDEIVLPKSKETSSSVNFMAKT